MMELHIWGPAFGLPSIDAECLATVAYLHQSLQPDQWNLVAGSDPSQSPTGDYPCLHHDERTIAGYSAIVRHLESSNSSLDSHLSPIQRANSTAAAVHLTANALPLIDANLYTSSTNYLSSTRPAWRQIVPPVAASLVPAQRYKLSSSRTSSLGLTASSVDDLPTSDFTPLQQQEARMISSSPSLLFRRTQTVQAALKVQQSTAKFRLDAMVEELVEPLDDILGRKRYLVSSEHSTAVDCLCYGYMALLLYPELPNTWIAETIQKKYPRIAKYVDRLRDAFFGGLVFDVQEIMQHAPAPALSPPPPNSLPWIPPPQPSMQTSAAHLIRAATAQLSTALEHIPAFADQNMPLGNTPSPTSLRPWFAPLNLLLTLAGPLLVGGAWLLYAETHGDLSRDKYFGRPRPAMDSFGAAADIFAGLGAFGFGGNSTDGSGGGMMTREQDGGLRGGEMGVVDVSVGVQD